MSTEHQYSENLLRKPEIVALTTDIALSTLALLAAVLALLQVHGFLQLGALSSIGNFIGTVGAYSLFSLVGGILLFNTITFLGKQSFLIASFRHRQQELEREYQAFLQQNNTREGEIHTLEAQLPQTQEVQTSFLENENRQLYGRIRELEMLLPANPLFAPVEQPTVPSQNLGENEALILYRELETGLPVNPLPARVEQNTALYQNLGRNVRLSYDSPNLSEQAVNSCFFYKGSMIQEPVEFLILRLAQRIFTSSFEQIQAAPSPRQLQLGETNIENSHSIRNASEPTEQVLFSDDWCYPSEEDSVPLLKYEFICFIKNLSENERGQYLQNLNRSMLFLDFLWNDDAVGTIPIDYLLMVVPRNYVDYVDRSSGDEKMTRIGEILKQLNKLSILINFDLGFVFANYQKKRVADARQFVLWEGNTEIKIDIIKFSQYFLRITDPEILNLACQELTFFQSIDEMIEYFMRTPVHLSILEWQINQKFNNNYFFEPHVENRIIEFERKSCFFKRCLSLLLKNEMIRNFYRHSN